MSTLGQFNKKNPTIKRILKEATELANSISTDFHAAPLEDNLFEWHFTIKGPPEPSPYAGGIYHGRIVLPSAYPHRPPSFRFLTPSGRFEVNREICLSISGFHEETWQPAWGIRTALVAIRSFMDTGAAGQVGGLECDDQSRKRMASESTAYTCPTCSASNEAIIAEREQVVQELEGQGVKAVEESVPEELRLAYREDLGGAAPSPAKGKEKAELAPPVSQGQATTTAVPVAKPATQRPANPPAAQVQTPSRAIPTATRPRPVPTQSPATPAWLDNAIYAIVALMALIVLQKLI